MTQPQKRQSIETEQYCVDCGDQGVECRRLLSGGRRTNNMTPYWLEPTGEEPGSIEECPKRTTSRPLAVITF